MTLTPRVYIDFDDDGVFAATESISSDILSVRWQRGREPDAENTPAGTAEFVVEDTGGNYVPDNALSYWGSDSDLVNSVRPGREVSIAIIYGSSTYQAFRGRINRITPQLGVKGNLTVAFYAVDAMDELGSNIISAITSTSPTTGGFANSSAGGFRLPNLTPVGASSGIIAQVLDTASWGSTRRQLSEEGPSLQYFWSYQESAKATLDKLETHDLGSMIFVNSSGSVTYHSSTHREGSIAQSTFNNDIHGWDYTFSLRNVYTSAEVTANIYPFSRDNTNLGSVATDASLTASGGGGTLSLRVPLSNAPVKSFTTPAKGINGSGNFAMVSTGGTTLAVADYEITGRMSAGSVVVLTITNNSTATATVRAAETTGSTEATLHITGRLDVGTTDSWTSLKFSSTGVAANAIAKYKMRRFVKDYPFGTNRTFAVDRVTAILDRYSPLRADYTRMTVIGSNSTDIPKLLTRDLGDRISVSASRLGVLNEHFYITAGEWELNQDGRTITVVYSLEKAT